MGTVDDYLATLPDDEREAYARVWRIAEETAGETGQGTSYGIPAITYHDRPLLLLQAAKAHLSVFPCSGNVVTKALPLLEGFDASKGTVRFTAEHPLPEEAVVALVQARMAEIDGGRR